MSYPEVAKIVDKICVKLGMGKDIRILDAAAGTGFVGKALHDIGYINLDAQDASQGMLNEARKKCIYKNYFQSYLGSSENKDLRDYDGITCIGAFTLAHLRVEAFDDLLSFAKQGGFICFTIRDDIGEIGEAYQNKMKHLLKNGSWKRLEHVRMVYYSKTGHMCSLYVYQKCWTLK